MAITSTVSELEAELVAIDAKIKEFEDIPLSGTVGRTTLNMSKNIELLERRRERVIDELRATYRRAGRLGPARREPV